MSDFVLPVSMLLYLVLPTLLLRRGWPIRAGIAMIVTALLPWAVWFLAVPRPWGPGAGIALMLTAVMLLVAVVPIAVGLTRAISRQSGRTSSTG